MKLSFIENLKSKIKIKERVSAVREAPFIAGAIELWSDVNDMIFEERSQRRAFKNNGVRLNRKNQLVKSISLKERLASFKEDRKAMKKSWKEFYDEVNEERSTIRQALGSRIKSLKLKSKTSNLLKGIKAKAVKAMLPKGFVVLSQDEISDLKKKAETPVVKEVVKEVPVVKEVIKEVIREVPVAAPVSSKEIKDLVVAKPRDLAVIKKEPSAEEIAEKKKFNSDVSSLMAAFRGISREDAEKRITEANKFEKEKADKEFNSQVSALMAAFGNVTRKEAESRIREANATNANKTKGYWPY